MNTIGWLLAFMAQVYCLIVAGVKFELRGLIIVLVAIIAKSIAIRCRDNLKNGRGN